MYSYEYDPNYAFIEGKVAPTLKVIEQFITKMLLKMKLTNEVILMAFIFIERLIVSPLLNHSIFRKKVRFTS